MYIISENVLSIFFGEISVSLSEDDQIGQMHVGINMWLKTNDTKLSEDYTFWQM